MDVLFLFGARGWKYTGKTRPVLTSFPGRATLYETVEAEIKPAAHAQRARALAETLVAANRQMDRRGRAERGEGDFSISIARRRAGVIGLRVCRHSNEVGEVFSSNKVVPQMYFHASVLVWGQVRFLFASIPVIRPRRRGPTDSRMTGRKDGTP